MQLPQSLFERGDADRRGGEGIAPAGQARSVLAHLEQGPGPSGVRSGAVGAPDAEAGGAGEVDGPDLVEHPEQGGERLRDLFRVKVVERAAVQPLGDDVVQPAGLAALDDPRDPGTRGDANVVAAIASLR